MVAKRARLDKLVYSPFLINDPDHSLAIAGRVLNRNLGHRDLDHLSLEDVDKVIQALESFHSRSISKRYPASSVPSEAC